MIVCRACEVAWEGTVPCWSCHTRPGEVSPVTIRSAHTFTWDGRFPVECSWQLWVPLWVTERARGSLCWFGSDFDVYEEAA